jgi:hypothetical protein
MFMCCAMQNGWCLCARVSDWRGREWDHPEGGVVDGGLCGLVGCDRSVGGYLCRVWVMWGFVGNQVRRCRLSVLLVGVCGLC